MSVPNPDEREFRFEQFLGNLLRAGVLLATAVVLLGGVLFLIRHGGEPPGHKAFHGEPDDLRLPVEIAERAFEGSGRGVIQAGLLLLIATPVSRVIFSALGFLRQRDYVYVVLTLIVLMVLLYSLFCGAAL